MLEHVWENYPSTLTPPPKSQSEWQLGWLILSSGESAWWSLTTVLHQFPRKSQQNATLINTNLQSLQVQIIWGFIWVSPSYTKYLMQIYALDMDHRQGSMLWWSQNPMMPRCRGFVLGWNRCFLSVKMNTKVSCRHRLQYQIFWCILIYVLVYFDILSFFVQVSKSFTQHNLQREFIWYYFFSLRLQNIYLLGIGPKGELGLRGKNESRFLNRWENRINQNDAFVFAGHACPNLEVRSRHQSILCTCRGFSM